jgi:3-hydroxyisobutyrate dehydrogenase-like beta-hydroxyacid dehydrogenase
VNPDERPLVVAVLGLGEAGSVIARDLVAAGAVVRGYDPAVAAGPGITDTGGEAEAARGADLVLRVNSAKAAVDAFRVGRSGLGSGALWADLNTAAPGLKRGLARLAETGGVPFADVAMMASVPGRGLRVPMLASGDGAERYARLLTQEPLRQWPQRLGQRLERVRPRMVREVDDDQVHALQEK